jgi:hypothetical protein
MGSSGSVMAASTAKRGERAECITINVKALVWRNRPMVDQSERAARLLVRALYYATGGEPRWWVLPTNLNDLTKEAIAFAVDRGWMLDRADSVCLTDTGRNLVVQHD